MSHDSIFPPLNPQKLREKLEVISSTDLIAVTLIDSSILLGSSFKFWEDVWHEEMMLPLGFNTNDGKRFGRSCVVHVPANIVAAVVKVPLDDASRPKISTDDPQVHVFRQLGIDHDLTLTAQEYPNPLASIIFEHNSSVVTAIGLEISDYAEKALSQDGISPEGIGFDNDFLMYADWPFFETQVGGNTNFSAAPVPGLVNITRSLDQSPEQQVLQRLKDTLSERIRRHVSSSTGKYAILRGCLLVPTLAQDEMIEGETCYLYKIAENRDDGTVYPVLIKAERLKYPVGFLNRINSVLTFYGELLPTPIDMLGEKYDEALLARAIAYLRD